MNELEAHLREAFETRLERVRPEREVRLRTFDYRGSRIRRSKPVAMAAAFSSALAGGIVAAVFLLSTGASPAYAGWSAVPTAPSPSALRAATAACDRMHSLSGPAILTGKPILTEARGKYTAALFLKAQVLHICISDGQHGGTSLAMSEETLFPAPGPHQLGLPVGFGGGAPGFPGSTTSGHYGHERNASGLAGSDVSAVIFNFGDGTTVHATVQDGRYFAWWPNNEWPTSVQVVTSSGNRTSPMSVTACGANCVFAERGQTPKQG